MNRGSAAWLGQRAEPPAGRSDGSIALAVTYQGVNAFVADYLLTIAQGQAFVATAQNLTAGTLLDLWLGVPGVEPRPVRGRVVQTDRVATHRGIAVEFLFSDEAERRAMYAWVESLVVEQLGRHHASALLRLRPQGRPAVPE